MGFGGLLDPATQMGLDKNDEDFGQTLGHWGVPPGPFLEVPFFGPSDTRDGPARIVDYLHGSDALHQQQLGVLWHLWRRFGRFDGPDLLSLDDTLQKVFDPYAFIRDAYLQRRAYLVSDGKVTDEVLVDPGADDTRYGCAKARAANADKSPAADARLRDKPESR